MLVEPSSVVIDMILDVDYLMTSPGCSDKLVDAWNSLSDVPAVKTLPTELRRPQKNYEQCRRIYEDGFTSESECEGNDRAPFDLSAWVIPALTVHLVDYDVDTGSEWSFVMIPVAGKCVAHYTWKAFQCAVAELAAETLNTYRSSERFRTLQHTGRVVPRVGHHKLSDKEIAGYRVFFPECNSERPAFIVEHLPTDGSQTRELMHLYPAMGLPKQHACVQMILGRMQDLYLSAALAGTIQKRWKVESTLVRNVCKGGRALILQKMWKEASETFSLNISEPSVAFTILGAIGVRECLEARRITECAVSLTNMAAHAPPALRESIRALLVDGSRSINPEIRCRGNVA